MASKGIYQHLALEKIYKLLIGVVSLTFFTYSTIEFIHIVPKLELDAYEKLGSFIAAFFFISKNILIILSFVLLLFKILFETSILVIAKTFQYPNGPLS